MNFSVLKRDKIINENFDYQFYFLVTVNLKLQDILIIHQILLIKHCKDFRFDNGIIK